MPSTLIPQLLGMQLLLLEDPQQQVSLPQSQLALHSLRLKGSRMPLPTLASNTPQPRAPRRTSDRASPLRPCTLSQHSSDCLSRPQRTHSAQPDRFFSSSEEYAKAWLDRKSAHALSRLYGSRRGWESGGDDVLELSRVSRYNSHTMGHKTLIESL